MIVVRVKKPSMMIRDHAPIVGIHLPMPKDRIAATVPNQMNSAPKP